MADLPLPVPISPFGPFIDLALRVHDLTVQGRHPETLVAADVAEAVATALGDHRTVRMIRLGRMYALVALGRLAEGLTIGEELTGERGAVTGPRSTDAKILADTAEVLIKIGRVDDGLHHLARAIALLEVAPRGSMRYVSAMSSLCEAARAAELYELADECARVTIGAFGTDELYRSASDMQHAELLLDWALRLDQIGRAEEAADLYARSVALLTPWAREHPDAPLVAALLAVGLAKTGRHDEVRELVGTLLVRMRAGGQQHEARLLHLAYGLVLRAAGELRAARREFVAADELAELPGQTLIFRYELATLALRESPGEATATMLATVRSQVALLWRLRLDRRTMLRQACRRVELEEARLRADLAATSDALTGLGNRRMFDRYMDQLRGGGVLLLIDVDRFKGINDEYSHGVGDRVLREIAAVLRAHCRQGEVAVRFGGDEFAMFLNTDLSAARHIAERIRQVILTRDWSDLALGLTVTLSMGMAAFLDGMTGRELYDRADGHLYRAKRQGRNRLAA